MPRNVILIAVIAVFILALPACATTKGATGKGAEGLKAVASPKPAMDFTLSDASNNEVSLADYKGKVVWLSFWATWCHACKLEMRFLDELAQKYGEQGFVVLAINVDGADARTQALGVARSLKLSYPVLFDPDSRVVGQYNPSMELPVSVLIGKDGKIHYVLKGYEAGENQDIEATVAAMLAK